MPSANVGEIVCDTADVIQRIHVIQPAVNSSFLELNWMGSFVLGHPESVERVFAAEFPPQPWVKSAFNKNPIP